MTDNRWTIRTTEWQPRIGNILCRGRQKKRWRDDIVKLAGGPGQGRQRKGLHHAVYGRHLATSNKKQETRS